MLKTFDFLFKLLLIGDSGVDKTTLLRLFKDAFNTINILRNMQNNSMAFGCFLSTILLAINPSSGFGLMNTMMLNLDLLEMLRSGGYDTRQPARIFLPPKYYSSIVFDSGHRSPEEIFRTNLELMMGAVYDGSLLNRIPSTAPLLQATLTTTAAATGGTLNRPNSISYSDGGAGNRNKGSGALEKNTVTNFKSSLLSSLAPSTGAPGKSSSSSIVADQTRKIVPSAGRSDHRRDGSSMGYNLRSALPGEPDVDYPILGRIPETSFKCHQRRDGYYADVETRCQVFRVCANTDDSGSGFAFLCPNGTLFNQKYFVCDWYMNVRCEESENYYTNNEKLGKSTTNFNKMMGEVMSMVSYPLMSSLLADGGFNTQRSDLFNDQANRVNGGGVKAGNTVQSTVSRAGNSVQPVEMLGRKSDVFQSKFNKENTYGEHTAKKEAHRTSQPAPVYVSSLGTLSTDPQSGFDPVKSTFLTSPIGRDLLPPRMNDFESLSSLNQHRLNEEIFTSPPMPSAEYELFMSNLLKTWADSGLAKMPDSRVQLQRPILPPSGVLPPSPVLFSPRRLASAAGKSQIIQSPVAPRNPNADTVQNVLRVNRVFVRPQNNNPVRYIVTAPKDYFIPKSTSSTRTNKPRNPKVPYINPTLPALSRRSDVEVPRYPMPVTVGREIGYDIEVVPAISYYLNNEQERKSFHHDLRKSSASENNKNTAGQTNYRGFSSYNVPIGSIGPFYTTNY